MAVFGLSDGSSWGSEATRPRRKRPYLSPSPLEEEWDDEEGGGGGWGGPWGSRDDRERPGRPREEEAEGGRSRGRSRPRWDPPRGGSGRSRSPPSISRSRRARRSLERSGESPGPSSSASAWHNPELRRRRAAHPSSADSPSSGGSSCSPAREGGRSRWRDGGSRAETPKERRWEPAPKRTSHWKSPRREEQGEHQHPAHGGRMMDSSSHRSSSSYRSKGVLGLEMRQDQDYRRRETYPEKEGRRQESHRGSDQSEGSYGGREWGSSRSKERSRLEARKDPYYQGRETYLKKRRRSGEKRMGPEPKEGGFSSYAEGEGGWRSPSQGGEQGGSYWGSPKWKDGREDSPSYRVQSHFDSDLRGSTWDSPELKRRDYERPSTSGKGLEMRQSTSEDLEDWGSSTGYLEEWNFEEDQADTKNLQGDLGGPEGRPKIYVGSDKRGVAPRMWVPRKEIVDFWNECQSALKSNVMKYLASICPRPSLPDRSCKVPMLNPSIQALLTRKQLDNYYFSSFFLNLTHAELLNMLGPVMNIYEMAEEAIETREAVKPVELREWARHITRYIGSLNQRLKLERCSQLLEMFDPSLKRIVTKLCGLRGEGLLIGKNRELFLKHVIQKVSKSDKRTNDGNAQNDRDQKHSSKKLASHVCVGAAELNERISAPQSFKAARGVRIEEGLSLALWHRRFGHQDEKAILDLQNRKLGVGIRINVADASRTALCAVCQRVKGPNPPSLPKAERMSTQVLDLIHVDLHGPFPEPSLRNKQYALIFVDDFSRYCFTYILKGKCAIDYILKRYLHSLNSSYHKKPKAFQVENEADSLSQASKAFLKEQGILYRGRGQQAPKDCGLAKKVMASLLDTTRCMLTDAALPDTFWDHAFMMATYLLNRLPRDGASKTPYELWYGHVPYMKHLRVFGSLAYSYDFQLERNKLRSSSERTIFLGFITKSRQYKVLNVETGQIQAQDVHSFEEEKAGNEGGTALDPCRAPDRIVDSVLGAAAAPSGPVSCGMQEEDFAEGEPSTPREGTDGW